MTHLDKLPGFRRRIAVVPRAGEVTSALEDDIHCMAVTLLHDGTTITAVRGEMERWPWDTCPGAQGALRAAFEGMPLAKATARGGKKRNCTHLYDLAQLAAANALGVRRTDYEVVVADPVDGITRAELRRNGQVALAWSLRSNELVAPDELAGTSVLALRDWIATLTQAEREAARILQWGCLIAHGRTLPWEYQSDASNMPANCHSFQTEVAAGATRTARPLDFSTGERAPLSHFDGKGFGA